MIDFLLFAAAAPASAPASDARSLQALHHLGVCVVNHTPRTAREVLAMDYRSPDYAQKVKAMGEGSGRCLARASKLQSNGMLFAGSIAEAFLKRDLAPKKLASHIAYDQTRTPIEARGPLEEMALCTAMRAPSDTAALFRTLPATPGESAAIRSLSPILGRCIAKGTQAELNKPAIRSLLALAAYRIVRTQKKAAQ